MDAILLAWLSTILFEVPVPPPPAPVGIEVLRSDIGELAINRSNWGTPLQVGGQIYPRGLGTHCVSELLVHLPEPADRFMAAVGLDTDPTILGRGGTVAFAVAVAGREVWRSGPIQRGMAAVLVDVPLDGATSFVLKTLEVEQGYNHANWLAPTAALTSGGTVDIETLPIVRRPSFADRLPFSFRYGGVPSQAFLSAWPRTVEEISGEDGRPVRRVTFTDPVTQLAVWCDVTVYPDSGAVDWVLHFENRGTADTPIIEDIRALDMAVRIPVGQGPVLHTNRGSSATALDFLPVAEAIAPGARVTVAPRNGLSSSGGADGDGRMPFFNLAWPGGGLMVALGWSGQWQLTVARDAPDRSPLEAKSARTPAEDRALRAFVMAERARNPARDVTLEAGQQTTRFRLHPGERVRSPRVLLVPWAGRDPIDGYNSLRRVLIAHYLPRRDGAVVMPPFASLALAHGQEFLSSTESNQLEAIPIMAGLGVEAYWHDTAWFTGGFPGGIGNWSHRADAFPRGLAPLGEAARRHGMGFVLWFDVERVVLGSETARTHPDWVLDADGAADGLFDLGNEAALAWLTEQIAGRIEAWGVTVYRQDCTIDPLPYWEAADEPGREGMAEIRHVENLYRLWDTLRARFPYLDIDNCAGGGRRLDLETLRRSWPLWRSDTQIFGRPNAVWNQAQTAGLSRCVPLHAAGVWAFDPYSARSTLTMGGALLADVRVPFFPRGDAQRALEEAKGLRPYWLGDYYPLTPIGTDEDQWIGWQFHRPDLDAGFALLFRRSACPYPTIEVHLRGLVSDARYRVLDADSGEVQIRTGEELTHLAVTLDARGSSVLLRYDRESPGRVPSPQ